MIYPFLSFVYIVLDRSHGFSARNQTSTPGAVLHVRPSPNSQNAFKDIRALIPKSGISVFNALSNPKSVARVCKICARMSLFLLAPPVHARNW